MNTPDGHDAIETLVRAIPVALKRAVVEMKQIAQATAAHVARLAAFARARCRARKLEGHAFAANVDLGRRMAELELGDAEQRGRIAGHQESILNLQAAGAKARRIAVELEVEEAKMAQIELQRGTPPLGAETEYVAAVTAREALQAQQANVALLRAAIRPVDRAHAMRLFAGCFIVCLLLLGTVTVGRQSQRGAAPGRRGDPTSVTAGTPAAIEAHGTEPATPANGRWERATQGEAERIASEGLAELDKSIAAKEKELADLGKAVAAKAKEPADLSSDANATRKSIPAAEAPKDNVYRTPTELFADMPNDAYPRFGPEGAIERAAARKWVKANLVGRTVEWTAIVKHVEISGDGPFTVRLGCTHKGLWRNRFLLFGGAFGLGNQSCQVLLSGWHTDFLHPGQSTQAFHLLAEVPYDSCTAAEADVLRNFKGKKIALRAKVVRSDVSNDRLRIDDHRVPFVLGVSLPSVDGFLPEASKGINMLRSPR
ncbi:MAG TPA: hypothetical protein VMV69_02345 [Pirellulales bacterium]|nr:hypothetical protein [Pirellulales bacterium]